MVLSQGQMFVRHKQSFQTSGLSLAPCWLGTGLRDHQAMTQGEEEALYGVARGLIGHACGLLTEHKHINHGKLKA